MDEWKDYVRRFASGLRQKEKLSVATIISVSRPRPKRFRWQWPWPYFGTCTITSSTFVTSSNDYKVSGSRFWIHSPKYNLTVENTHSTNIQGNCLARKKVGIISTGPGLKTTYSSFTSFTTVLLALGNYSTSWRKSWVRLRAGTKGEASAAEDWKTTNTFDDANRPNSKWS